MPRGFLWDPWLLPVRPGKEACLAALLGRLEPFASGRGGGLSKNKLLWSRQWLAVSFGNLLPQPPPPPLMESCVIPPPPHPLGGCIEWALFLGSSLSGEQPPRGLASPALPGSACQLSLGSCSGCPAGPPWLCLPRLPSRRSPPSFPKEGRRVSLMVHHVDPLTPLSSAGRLRSLTFVSAVDIIKRQAARRAEVVRCSCAFSHVTWKRAGSVDLLQIRSRRVAFISAPARSLGIRAALDLHRSI